MCNCNIALKLLAIHVSTIIAKLYSMIYYVRVWLAANIKITLLFLKQYS